MKKPKIKLSTYIHLVSLIITKKHSIYTKEEKCILCGRITNDILFGDNGIKVTIIKDGRITIFCPHCYNKVFNYKFTYTYS